MLDRDRGLVRGDKLIKFKDIPPASQGYQYGCAEYDDVRTILEMLKACQIQR